MSIRFLIICSSILFPSILYAELDKVVLLVPKKEKEAAFYFLAERHKKKTNIEDVDTVVSQCQSDEKSGTPATVLGEFANPIILHQGKYHDLLTKFPSRAKEELPNTVVQDIEIRRRSGIAENILSADLSGLLRLNPKDPVFEEIKRYTDGKTVFQLTYQDVLDEMQQMLTMVEEVRDMCSFDSTLYDQLSDELRNCKTFVASFEEAVNQYVTAQLSVFRTPKDKKQKMLARLAMVTDSIIEPYILKRNLELQKEAKEKMVVLKVLNMIGGAHADCIINWLCATKKFNELERITASADEPVPNDRLQWILQICICDYLLENLSKEPQHANASVSLSVIELTFMAIKGFISSFC